jgi:hypothetical protein
MSRKAVGLSLFVVLSRAGFRPFARRRVDVEENRTLIVVQATEAGEIETTFDIP